MKVLARAVINAACFLELADERTIDPDLALEALEEIAYTLSHCTPAEKEAIGEVLDEMRASELETGPRPEMLDFLNGFLSAFGLENPEDDESDEEPPSRLNLL